MRLLQIGTISAIFILSACKSDYSRIQVSIGKSGSGGDTSNADQESSGSSADSVSTAEGSGSATGSATGSGSGSAGGDNTANSPISGKFLGKISNEKSTNAFRAKSVFARLIQANGDPMIIVISSKAVTRYEYEIPARYECKECEKKNDDGSCEVEHQTTETSGQIHVSVVDFPSRDGDEFIAERLPPQPGEDASAEDSLAWVAMFTKRNEVGLSAVAMPDSLFPVVLALPENSAISLKFTQRPKKAGDLAKAKLTLLMEEGGKNFEYSADLEFDLHDFRAPMPEVPKCEKGEYPIGIWED